MSLEKLNITKMLPKLTVHLRNLDYYQLAILVSMWLL